MKERPILFSGAMVRAILAGQKTQTRRVVKGAALNWLDRDGFTPEFVALPENRMCPYGQPGDRLWVRETFVQGYDEDTVTGCLLQYDSDGNRIPMKTWYRATDRIEWADSDGWAVDNPPWKPSIHMPRSACRLLLEITAVRVERLQDINEADTRAEGAPDYEEGIDEPPPDGEHEWSYRASFRRLWERINGPDSWNANPWVWVVEFKRIEQEG